MGYVVELMTLYRHSLLGLLKASLLTETNVVDIIPCQLHTRSQCPMTTTDMGCIYQ